MQARSDTPASHVGMLLLAHPVLQDPSFARSVVLLSSHDANGALGVVLNQPLDQRLGDVSGEFAIGPLAAVPLYRGGPVETDKLIFAGWRWLEERSEFQIQFGLDPVRAEQLALDASATLRGFFGYAGWSAGQLEQEMAVGTWVVAEPADFDLSAKDGAALWRQLMGEVNPQLLVSADEPEDPTLN